MAAAYVLHSPIGFWNQGFGGRGSFLKNPFPRISPVPYFKMTGWKHSGRWKSGFGATTGAHVPKCGWIVSSQQ